MATAISSHPGDTITIVVERNGERVTLTVTPANEKGKGKIGVSNIRKHIDLDAKSAALLAVTQPPRVVRDVVVGIGELITGKAKGELVGPFGISNEIAKAAESSWADFWPTIGAISAYLGAFNLIPFPALDGGRLVFLAYEATTRKRPNAWIEQNIHLFGILVLIGVMLYVTYRDVAPGPK